MSGLLLLTATAVACLLMRKKSMDKIGYTYRRNRYYGGNRTTFYSWLDDNFLSIYTDHKNEIDKLSLEWHKNNQKLKENYAYRYAYEGEEYDKETATYQMRCLLSRDITDDNYEELHKKINEYEATDEDIKNLNLLYKQGCEIDNRNKKIENTVYNLFYT